MAFFLQKQDGGYILQENGFRLIILETPDGGSGGSSKAVGVSLVKKQLGERPIEKASSRVKGKLLIRTRGRTTSKVTDKPISRNIAVSKLCLKESCTVIASLLFSEKFTSHSKLFRKETYSTIDVVGEHPLSETIKQVDYIKKEQIRLSAQYAKTEKQQRLEKLKTILELVDSIPINKEILDTPLIDVSLGRDVIRQGQLLRITTDVNKQVPQLWLRILDDKGVIVQKAGLVKRDATGFQILVSTQQLDRGKYVIQVSSKNNFTPIGIAEFEVEGKSPIPLLAIAPGILTPDTTPDQDIEWVIYRTMMDNRVDGKCLPFENKRYRFNDPNKPNIPIHFNCRCFYEIDKKK